MPDPERAHRQEEMGERKAEAEKAEAGVDGLFEGRGGKVGERCGRSPTNG